MIGYHLRLNSKHTTLRQGLIELPDYLGTARGDATLDAITQEWLIRHGTPIYKPEFVLSRVTVEEIKRFYVGHIEQETEND